MRRTFLTVVILLGIVGLRSFPWGMGTHEDITEVCLRGLVGSSLADEISDHADEPDLFHLACPPIGMFPCLHGHRVTPFLGPKDGRFQGKGGAELGAEFWAEEARRAYLANDKTWMAYFGWATHYVADALCPAHCQHPTNPGFWDEEKVFFDRFVSRGAALEAYFEVRHAELVRYRDALERPETVVREMPVFNRPVDIALWLRGKADEVRMKNGRASPDLPCLSDADYREIFAWISHGIRGVYRYIVQGKAVTGAPASATLLVMDVSGSMAWQWRGGVKIESAKKAALQFIEQVANEPRPSGQPHLIGVVTFSDGASVVCPLTGDYAVAKQTIIRLGTLASTNLGAGLSAALVELGKVTSSTKCSIILLSDGMTNTGLSRDQILAGPVAEARRRDICIYTVGFGDPGDIDEDFLRKVATGSGCGTYNYAGSGFELFGTYVKVRHSMLGSNRIVEFTSGPSPVVLLPGQSAVLGAFQLTAPAQELHYTLAWSENGQMRAILVDPSNRQVTATYPGATIYSGNGFTHITVRSPQTGIWRVSAAAVSSFLSGVQYYGVASARTGGVVIPYRLPQICFTIPGVQKEVCLAMPDMPTVVVVAVAIAATVVLVYLQLTSK